MSDVDVLVVGGGPVGLYLGCLLAKTDCTFRILEARREAVDHSRSIGIHPPLLESMRAIGLADRLIDDGVRIRQGHGFWNGHSFGAMDFERLAGPYRFVLSLPQTRTEWHLRERLGELAPGVLQRGERVTSLHLDTDCVRVRSEGHSGAPGEWNARVVVGADGKYSTIRSKAGFAFDGGAYPDRYLMGDFAESTELGSDAALCLGRDGLVESFPLPSGERRWVVRLSGESAADGPGNEPGDFGHTKHPDQMSTANLPDMDIARRIAQTVSARTPFHIDASSASMTSAFGVERYEARPTASGRVFLAGDAAHIVSPIGGQGMNLGWLDADDLANVLESLPGRIGTNYRTIDKAAGAYSIRRRRAFGKARRRAEFNMWMGRSRPGGPGGAIVSALKAVTARLILVPGIRAACARQFTMHGLDA